MLRKGDSIIDHETGLEGKIDTIQGNMVVYKSGGSYYTQDIHNVSVYVCTPKLTPKHPAPASYGSLANTKVEKKEGSKMLNVKKLFGEFGKVKNNEVALTFGGHIAIRRSADEYVRYNPEKEQIENHMGMIFEAASGMMFILPVTAVAEADVIKFKNTYYQVVKVNENGSLAAINLSTGTKSTICKETNVIGFNFYYKVVSIFADGANTTSTGINPMLFFLLSDKGEDIGDILPLLLLSGQTGTPAEGGQMNPLLLMTMLGDGKTDMKDMLMLSALSGGGMFGTATPATDAAGTPAGFAGLSPMAMMLMAGK